MSRESPDRAEEPRTYSSLQEVERIAADHREVSRILCKNAELKRELAQVEAENAHRVINRHKLRGQTSDYASMEEMNRSIGGMSPVKVVQKTVRRSTVADESICVERHQEELRRAREEIKRLSKQVKRSDEAISECERTYRERRVEGTRLVEVVTRTMNEVSVKDVEVVKLKKKRSALGKRLEAVERERLDSEAEGMSRLAQVEQELEQVVAVNMKLQSKANASRRAKDVLEDRGWQERFAEIERVNRRLRGVKDRGDREIATVQHEINGIQKCLLTTAGKYTGPLSAGAKAYLLMLSDNFTMKMNFFVSKFETEMSKLDVHFSKVNRAWKEMSVLRTRALMDGEVRPDKRDLVSCVDRWVKRIDVLSHSYARPAGFPSRRVPGASTVLTDREALRDFVGEVETRLYNQ